jgi:hypothetical protein
MHRIGIAAATAAGAALMMMAPLTASAAPAPAVTLTLATCADPLVNATFNAEVYSGPDSFNQVSSVSVGNPYFCAASGVFLGRRYTACEESDGNGWIEVTGNNGATGWSPQACFEDV